jgi:tetratricopeptide (TPR) repeat protein
MFRFVFRLRVGHIDIILANVKRVKLFAALGGIIGILACCGWLLSYFGRSDDAAMAAWHRALQYKHAKRFDLAEKEFLVGIRKAKTPQPMIYRSLAHVYYRDHKYIRAAKYYEMTIDADPRYEASVLWLLADCYAELGKSETALEYLTYLRKRYPEKFDRYAQLLLELIQNAPNRNAKTQQAEVAVRVDIPARYQNNGPFSIGGNWLPDGTQSDAYGYDYQPLQSGSRGSFQFHLSLATPADFPYQAVIRDGAGTPVAFRRFVVGDKGEALTVVNIGPEDKPGSSFYMGARDRVRRP